MLIFLLILPVLLIVRLSGNRKAIRYFTVFCQRAWASVLLVIAGIKVKTFGLENLPEHDNICLVSNHQSNLDIPIVLSSIPKIVGFIAKRELIYVPILNFWMYQIGCVFIDRKKRSESVKKINDRLERVKQGEPMLLFPEGTRSKSAKTGKFKRGGLHAVVNAGVSVVPITISGAYKLWEAVEHVKPGAVHIYIHSEIKTADFDEKQKSEFVENLIEIITQPLANEI